MEIKVPHSLGRKAAAERILEAVKKFDLEEDPEAVQAEDRGGLVKATPLGAVKAAWEAYDDEVIVQIQKPAWLPDDAVRTPLEKGLREALAD